MLDNFINVYLFDQLIIILKVANLMCLTNKNLCILPKKESLKCQKNVQKLNKIIKKWKNIRLHSLIEIYLDVLK